MSGLEPLLAALETVYNPRSSNAERSVAQMLLDSAKTDPQAPFFGHQLALPQQKDFIVRHFGLNLMLHSMTANFKNWDAPKQLAVKTWIIDLATKVQSDDPHYIKEKIAFLWVELAKRCWGHGLVMAIQQNQESMTQDQLEISWASMDSNLWELWNHNDISRNLAMIIQRTLYEDIYLLEDSISIKRKPILNTLCSETVLSLEIIQQTFKPCDLYRLYAGSNKGWLLTWQESLSLALNQHDDQTIIKLLEIIKIVVYWIFPLAIKKSNIINEIFQCLNYPNEKIKILAIETLNTFYSKEFNSDEDYQWIKDSIFNNDIYTQLFQVLSSIQIDLDDLSNDSYTLLKRLTEFVITLTDYVINRTGIKTSHDDFTNFYKLILELTKSQSPIVSNICLPFWVNILRLDELSDQPDFECILPGLLEQAANRLINYQDYDSEDPIIIYIENEFDNSTDKSSFLTNLKKSNDDILRIIICKKPSDGLEWLAQRLNSFYSSPMGQESMNSNKLVYKGSNSITYHLSYAQFVIIEACVRGVSRWKIWYKEPDMETKKQYLIEQLNSLCLTLIQLKFQDYNLQRKKIQTLVQFSPLLKDSNDTMFKVLEIVIDACITPYPEEQVDDDVMESIRDLRACSGTEMNRMAYLIPDNLTKILPQLEDVINNLISSGKVSPHELVGFKSFLLVVSQRSNIDLETKRVRFERIVDPELVAWTDPQTIKALEDLHWFMERIGIIKIRDYFIKRGISPQMDLLSIPMDQEGKQLKKQLKDQWTLAFPVRPTRVLIQYSIEKLPHDSETYKYLLKMWQPRVERILEYVLRLIYQIQAYHNPNNWVDLPLEVQTFIQYSIQERFWQEGISIQSKETFQEENVQAMHTLRDFADSLGHIIRYTREYAYMVLQSFSDLETTLYNIPNVSSTIWNALTSQREGITLHSWRHMITTVVRPLIKNCPLECQENFMKQFLPLMFVTLDEVLILQWSTVVISENQQVNSDEELSREMLQEHMLRQLTQVIVRMMIDLLGQGTNNSLNANQKGMRALIKQNDDLWLIIMKFLAHVASFKDTRCTFNSILIMRHLCQEIIAGSMNTTTIIEDSHVATMTSQDNDQNLNLVERYILEEIIPLLVNIIKDKFYLDAHSEASYTLTLIYLSLRSKTYLPGKILSNLLGLTREEIMQFEVDLDLTFKAKDKRNLMTRFIKEHIEAAGGSSSANGGAVGTDDFGKDRNKLVANVIKRLKNGNGNDKDILDDGGIVGLFGDD